MKIFNRSQNDKPVPERSEVERSDETELVWLLDQHRREADQSKRQEFERRILELIDRYFRMAIRPVMAKIFGHEVLRQDQDSSLRYTEMMNSFFVKVLASRPDEMWRATTARDLRNWASTVMANHMRDYLRRKKRGREILNDEIAPLYEIRKRHFEKRFQDRFDDFLELLDSEMQSLPDSQRRLLKLHYLDGLNWEETATELGLSKSEFYRQRDAALECLRHEFDR